MELRRFVEIHFVFLRLIQRRLVIRKNACDAFLQRSLGISASASKSRIHKISQKSSKKIMKSLYLFGIHRFIFCEYPLE
jgi:hypothetical protein